VRPEAPKLLKLEEVSAGTYQSRRGGFLKLRFERNRFAFIHSATEAMLENWQSNVGRYYWIRRSWKFAPDLMWPVYSIEGLA
jgi:hypothetical protein